MKLSESWILSENRIKTTEVLGILGYEKNFNFKQEE